MPGPCKFTVEGPDGAGRQRQEQESEAGEPQVLQQHDQQEAGPAQQDRHARVAVALVGGRRQAGIPNHRGSRDAKGDRRHQHGRDAAPAIAGAACRAARTHGHGARPATRGAGARCGCRCAGAGVQVQVRVQVRMRAQVHGRPGPAAHSPEQGSWPGPSSWNMELISRGMKKMRPYMEQAISIHTTPR